MTVGSWSCGIWTKLQHKNEPLERLFPQRRTKHLDTLRAWRMERVRGGCWRCHCKKRKLQREAEPQGWTYFFWVNIQFDLMSYDLECAVSLSRVNNAQDDRWTWLLNMIHIKNNEGLSHGCRWGFTSGIISASLCVPTNYSRGFQPHLLGGCILWNWHFLEPFPQKGGIYTKLFENAGINNLKDWSSYYHPCVVLQVNFLKALEEDLEHGVFLRYDTLANNVAQKK